MRPSSGSSLAMAAAALALTACLHAAPGVGPGQVPAESQGQGQGRQEPAPPAAAAPAARQLIAAKARLMAADYRADLPELARWRDQAALLGGDPALGYLAHYWAGFASWRIAINGASHGMGRDDLKANLERAETDFEAAIRLRDDFADAYGAAAGVQSWLLVFLQDDPAAFRQVLDSGSHHLTRALRLAPDNARVLWVEGGSIAFKPAAYGGDVQRGMQIYRRAAEVAEAPDPSSPLPDWGKPEVLMSLAYFHLNQAAPDLAAATEEAHAALRLQPEWSYVRDILLPMIEARRRQPAASAPPDAKPAPPAAAAPPPS
ncbi:MAG TPA: hypothetical protein VKY89_11060 [Thermoanaerobaculia bacterium]|nr:hypothetical protein [Thermoanaerobaculia bacterium]